MNQLKEAALSAKAYIGRFAPSPSGPLHMGSLVTALGSFLQAKANQGKWLLRIDDIDPPRMVAGASEDILNTLQIHGLYWDQDVVYQSHNTKRYEQALSALQNLNLIYPCICTRAQIKAAGGLYKGVCREKAHVDKPSSLRFRNDSTIVRIYDQRLGEVFVDVNATNEDFIVKRKDGLYAYHLASVADDIAMEITEVVRGEDLLLPTACQWSLFQALGANQPSSMHLPLVTLDDGRKLSKQNGAPALNNTKPLQNIIDALQILDIQIPIERHGSNLNSLLKLAITHWQTKKFPRTA